MRKKILKNKPRTIPLARELRGKKVIVAMSGGVDSSVAAALLKREGFEVVGVFLKLWSDPRGGSSPLIHADSNADSRGYGNKCCSSESEKRARLVAEKLGIPFYVFNFEKEFKKKVVDYFLKEYKAGRTPNPCVVCNKEIKFGLLLEKALKLGTDYVATGHYVRKQESRIKNQELRYKLLKAKDKKKDQSYFLWKLNQKILKRTLFPVGDYTKEEVRKLAKNFKLPNYNAPESQEICFIQTGINDFLKKYLKPKPGPIILPTSHVGKVLGEHQGLWFFTIGQRKGIGLAGGPFYVLDKDIKKNILIVTQNKKDLNKKELITQDVNWISGKVPKFPLKVRAKIRYRHKLSPATLKDAHHFVFDRPQRAITPGQSVVFYKGQELLGGGIIC